MSDTWNLFKKMWKSLNVHQKSIFYIFGLLIPIVIGAVIGFKSEVKPHDFFELLMGDNQMSWKVGLVTFYICVLAVVLTLRKPFFKVYRESMLLGRYPERLLRVQQLEKNLKIKRAEAEKRVTGEETAEIKQRKELEILGGFVKVLEYLRGASFFYIKLIISFFIFAAVCVLMIILMAKNPNIFHEVVFDDKSTSRIILEMIGSNLRFIIYESLTITLLGYFLKKISYYISLLEIYKELEILLIMDVQRQDRKPDKKQRGIVSEKFQDRFAKMLIKHEDSFMKKGAQLKLKTIGEVAQVINGGKKS